MHPACWLLQTITGELRRTSRAELQSLLSFLLPPSSAIESNNRVVLVCSARSGTTKTSGTTNLLIRASLEALRPTPAATNPDNSPSASGAPTPSANGPSVNPLSLTSQIFQRSGSSNALPSLTNGTFSSWQSRSNSPAMSPSRRSMSNSFSSIRDEAPGPQQFETTIEQIRNDHIASARAAIKNEEILEALEDEIHYDCDQLRSFLMAAQILEEISPRSKDTIIGVGERLSCRIVAAALRDRVSANFQTQKFPSCLTKHAGYRFRTRFAREYPTKSK